ncbi:MAG: DUF456 family protein [Anaerolineales bacterium]|nr:DUF456 family protein [Anaerolineales bacterium]
MDSSFWELLAKSVIQALTFVVLIVGWIGLLVPVFPGLTVMWLAALGYALIQSALGQMAWLGWTLFAFITLLMLVGNIADNIIIAKHVRDKNVPWSSILWAFAAGVVFSVAFTPVIGIVSSPVALFAAEWQRLKDRFQALDNTQAWMTGWGWSIAARMGVGAAMIILWGIWAFNSA